MEKYIKISEINDVVKIDIQSSSIFYYKKIPIKINYSDRGRMKRYSYNIENIIYSFPLDDKEQTLISAINVIENNKPVHETAPDGTPFSSMEIKKINEEDLIKWLINNNWIKE